MTSGVVFRDLMSEITCFFFSVLRAMFTQRVCTRKTSFLAGLDRSSHTSAALVLIGIRIEMPLAETMMMMVGCLSRKAK